MKNNQLEQNGFYKEKIMQTELEFENLHVYCGLPQMKKLIYIVYNDLGWSSMRPLMSMMCFWCCKPIPTIFYGTHYCKHVRLNRF